MYAEIIESAYADRTPRIARLAGRPVLTFETF
jgi:hypothetical protein